MNNMCSKCDKRKAKMNHGMRGHLCRACYDQQPKNKEIIAKISELLTYIR